MKKIYLFVYFFIGLVVLGFAAEAEMVVPANLQNDYNEYIKTEKEKAVEKIAQGAYSLDYTDWGGGIRCKAASKESPGRVVRQVTATSVVYCLDGKLLCQHFDSKKEDTCYASIWDQTVDKAKLRQDALAHAKRWMVLRPIITTGVILLLVIIITIVIVLVKVIKKTYAKEVVFFTSCSDAYVSTLSGIVLFIVLVLTFCCLGGLYYSFKTENLLDITGLVVIILIALLPVVIIGYNIYKVNKTNSNLSRGARFAIILARCTLTIIIPVAFLFSMQGAIKTKEDTEGSYMLKQGLALAITVGLFYGIHKFLMSLVADYDLLDSHLDKEGFYDEMKGHVKMISEATDKIVKEQQEQRELKKKNR